MSPQMVGLRARAEGGHVKPLTKYHGTDNGYSGNKIRGDSESVADSPLKVGLRGGRYRRYSLEDKLAARTVKGPGCWNVTGAAVHGGYVHINHGKKFIKAHRIAWELAHGPIPAHLRVLHSCDNPRCVNVAHLRLGTQAENVHESIRKGRYNTYGHQKLNAEQVLAIRAAWRGGALQKDIAKAFGCSKNHVSAIVNRRCWDHLEDVVTPADIIRAQIREARAKGAA